MAPVHEDLVDVVALQLKQERTHVANVVKLLEGTATVPFIARYRKELTGGLSASAVHEIRDLYEEVVQLRTRKKKVVRNLRRLDKISPEFEEKIEACGDALMIEDLYRPFRTKRDPSTLAARGKGLGPFAEEALSFDPPADVEAIAEKAAAELENVATPEEALEGIRDILAELFAEDGEVRAQVRVFARKEGKICSTVLAGKENESSRFQKYYKFSEPVSAIPAHRLLAIRRGEKEGFLTMSLEVDHDKVMEIMEKRILLTDDEKHNAFLRGVIRHAADKLLLPEISGEERAAAKRRADLESIKVFSENLRDMLYTPPAGAVTVIGVDPGSRTGTRVVVVDAEGNNVDSAMLFLNESEEKNEEALAILRELVEKHDPRFIAVGNGSTSRESEKALRSLLARLEKRPGFVMVNETGISVYVSSPAAKEEFPNLDIASRAAVSMARRVQDPLAEFVKVDPRHIGVGQYQHDVNQTILRKRLSEVVSSCVNMVCADLNKSSPQFLSYVSGLTPELVDAIVEHRRTSAPFGSRARLMEVKGIGPKTFEQCAGFLKVRNGDIPLDKTTVHPESYHIVEKMAGELGKTLDDLMADPSCLEGVEPEKFVDEKAGLPTIKHIIEELRKPDSDPRGTFQEVHFRDDVTDVNHLKPGMVLEGRVSNVTHFGAFIDVGVHHDGLVHISEISNQFVSDPSEVVRVGQVVKVRVLGVEMEGERARVSLSMNLEASKPGRGRGQRGGRKGDAKPRRRRPRQPEKLRTLDDLLNRFGDPRKPRLD